MNIPEQFEELLKNNQALYGAVISTIAKFEELLAKAEMTFFPEYTDHSHVHVQEVLDTIAFLIPKEVWTKNLLTPNDAATIILATLVHDSAMKLTKEGFVCLRGGKYNAIPNERFSDKPWPDLWDEFIREARLFDGKKLKSMFGSTDPVQRPEDSPTNWTEQDRLLIGEFLRRHHHRLAHEFALHGFPGKKEPLKFNEDVPDHIRDLAGIVARSHGMDLRNCIDVALDNEEKVEYSGVHVPYLMGLLRISDYFQVHSGRVSMVLWNLRSLQSSISKVEWEKHRSVINVSTKQQDPESIYINAIPKTVKTFFLLKNLFGDIQRELDSTWAVFGEIYGRFTDEGLNRLGLKVRRLYSNIDSKEKFSKKVDFIPEHLCLRTKDASVLELLIRPLYDNRPEYGIRELVQNSVDAVRELTDYQKTHTDLLPFEQQQQDTDVVVKIEESQDGDGGWFTIADNGIGMKVETIRDYFLTAGASFRQSDLWLRQHTDDGESRVLRSGRFGVGVLAAFLLGDEIQITTRHITSPVGLELSLKIDDEHIEAKKKNVPFGTKISIRISSKTMEVLIGNKEDTLFENKRWDWNWYVDSVPSIYYSILNKSFINDEYNKPLLNEQKLVHYFRSNEIHHPSYQKILWSWDIPVDICNGIKIEGIGNYRVERDYFPGLFSKSNKQELLLDGNRYSFSILKPNIAVYDANANLPLNLQRTNIIQNSLQFKKELLDDVCKDFIAYCLVNAPETPPWEKNLEQENKNNRFPGLLSTQTKYHFSPPRTFGYCLEGTFFLDICLVNELGIEKLLILPNEKEGIKLFSETTVHTNYGLFYYDYELEDLDFERETDNLEDWISHATGARSEPGFDDFDILQIVYVTGIRIILNSDIDYYAVNSATSSRSFIYQEQEEFWEDEPAIEEVGKYQIVQNGIFTDNSKSFEELYFAVEKTEISSAMLLQLLPKAYNSDTPSPIAEAWKLYIKTPYIPFENQQERQKRFSHAYEDLASYIEKWKKQKPLHPKKVVDK